jgi:hypothetical protein
MALADWLNPATPQPTYLTSRAMGVVVPEYFKAAADVRKTALGLAGQEQSLRINEEEAQRQRDAERRRKEEEAAAAALMPGLTSLDPRSPTYFQDLTRELSKPGAANALASRSVQSFLGVAGEARAESTRQKELADANQRRIEEEGRIAEREVAREDRADARSSLEGVERLAQKYAEDLGDEDFLPSYSKKINEIRSLQQTRPTEVPAKLASLTEELTRDRNQRSTKKDLLDLGFSPAEIEALKKLDGGKLGDNARAQIGRRKQAASATAILNAEIETLQYKIKAEPARRREYMAELDRLLTQAKNLGAAGRPDAAQDFLDRNRGAAGSPPSTQGSSEAF